MSVLRGFLYALLLAVVPAAAGKEALPVTRSVCLVKGGNGSGSGFFAAFDGQSVFITNNHVLLGLKDPKIVDINGREYPFDKVYASPDRDLAVVLLRRENSADMPDLQIHSCPDMLKLNTGAAAYGNSLGDGVVVRAPGRFLGIGPEVIEVDAPFVSGNSGGPVLEESSGKVIGVATYCRILRSGNATTIGSRFSSGKYNTAIRRFATRLDGLKLKDFQQVTLLDIRQDQVAAEPISRAHREVLQLTGQPMTERIFIRRLSEILSRNPVWNMPLKWHTEYLRKDTLDKLKLLIMLRNMLEPERKTALPENPDVEDSIRRIWQKYLPETTFRTVSPANRKCFFCNGFGKIRQNVQETGNSRRRLQSSFRMVPCSLCGASGKMAAPPCEIAVPPAGFHQELGKVLKVEPHKIGPFRLGEDCGNFPPFYSSRSRRILRTGVYSVCRFAGNHAIRNAVETRFWLVGKKLLRIDVILPVTDARQIADTRANLRVEFADFTHASSRTVLLMRCADLLRIQFSPGMLRNLNASFQNDLFGLYCPEIPGISAQAPATGKRLLAVIFQHQAWEGCMGLRRQINRGYVF